jgi:acyl-CoA synthetase (AMP-forming)/AMP-acid ligase II
VDPSLQSRLFAQLEQDPQRRALGFMTPDGKIAWRTRDEIGHRAMGCAARLAEHGLQQGDVGLLVLPSNEFCAITLLGVLMLGAVPVLMAPPLFQNASGDWTAMLRRILRRTKARLVVCPESLSNLREELSATRRGARFVFGENELAGDVSASPRLASPKNDALAALQMTSGTTGVPRLCVWRQHQVLAALDGMAASMRLTADDVCFNWTPLYHDMGLVNNFLLCVTRGVPLVMLSPHEFIKRPALWLSGLSQSGATLTWSPNFGFAIAAQRLRDEELDGVRLDRVRAFWNAAERIHLETLNRFYGRFAPLGLKQAALKTNYGCAENVGGATFSDPESLFIAERVNRSALHDGGIAQVADASADAVETISVVSVGRPAPGIRIEILSRTGRPLPEGRVGEVALETPSRMAGYLGQARDTRHALHGTFVRTGDLGYVRNQELFWVGRLRERIVLRGKKLDPSDFEVPLARISGLRQGCFAVFGVDEEQSGTQRVVLITEVRDSGDYDRAALSREIREQIFLHLGVEVSEILLAGPGMLPKTSSGKRRHRHFRRLYLDGKLSYLNS